jgi:hypothetical protein
MIIHTRLLWFAAGLTVNQHLIIVHPKYRDDFQLLAHEFTHQAQMKQHGTLTFWKRYLTDKVFRLSAEVEAYKVQISHGASRSRCATHLSTMYRLGLDYATAYALLG